MSYPGGKNGAGVYQTIINLMPPHEVYIEPFLGGGAILRLKQPASVNIGIDLDSAAIARMREWARARSRHAKSDGARARRPPSPETPMPSATVKSGDALRRPTPEKAMYDRQFCFLCEDGIAFLKSYPFDGSELVYCDPPYMPETLRSPCQYNFELSDAQHFELLRVLRTLPCRVMISGYWTLLYSKVLRKWNSIHYQAQTRGRHVATEWLWFNFPEPVALHDYRYLGSNFREREYLKRMKLRWTARLEKMPLLKRRCLLLAIASIAGNGESAGGIVISGDGRRR